MPIGIIKWDLKSCPPRATPAQSVVSHSSSGLFTNCFTLKFFSPPAITVARQNEITILLYGFA